MSPWTWIIFVIPVAAVLFAVFSSHLWPWHYQSFSKVGNGPDATTLISTLIVIYTFFVAAYGALAAPLIDKGALTWRSVSKSGRTRLRAAALWSMIVGVGLDLIRVFNSTGDLYTTTMRHLDAAKIHDAADEFMRYFAVNVVILVLALVITCWPEPPEDKTLNSQA